MGRREPMSLIIASFFLENLDKIQLFAAATSKKRVTKFVGGAHLACGGGSTWCGGGGGTGGGMAVRQRRRWLTSSFPTEAIFDTLCCHGCVSL